MKFSRGLYGVILALGLSCSFQVNAQTQFISDCENPEKKASRDSSCLTSATMITATSRSSTTGATSGNGLITPFSVLGASCTTPWGATVPDGQAVDAFMIPSGTYDYAGKAWATDCQEEVRICVNGTLSGSYQYQSCDLQAVNGSCGSANGQYYTYPTSGPVPGTLCNPEYTYGGVAPSTDSSPTTPASSAVSLNTSTNRYSWTCSGELGGSTASCQAYRRINGQCGSSINSCSLGGVASQTYSNNKYPNYACNCTTNTSGVTTCTASATGTQTCTGGYKDTTYNWQCTGVNTGTTASCNATAYDSGQSAATPTPTPPCGATAVNDTQSCTSGYSGTRSRTNTYDTCTNTVIAYGTWDTSGCSACVNNATGTDSAACDAGYTGTKSRTKYTNSCTGVVSYGSWNTSGCTAACTDNATGTDSAACDAGYTGTKSRPKYINSCTGVVTYGTWNTSTCTACVNNPSGTDSAACDAGYTGTKSRAKYTNSCTGALSYGSWDTSACTVSTCSNVETGTDTATCGSGYSGNKTRKQYTDSCTGVISYGSWNTASCTLLKPTASGSFNKSTVAANGTATFSWSTSGATISTNVDCWNVASGTYRGSAASGSITVTFTGAGTGACNVAAINAAGQTDGTDTIDVTPVVCTDNYSATESAVCGTGYTGNKSRVKYINSCTGVASYSAWDMSGCTACANNASGTESATCDAGYTGTKTRTKYINSCTGAVTYSTWNTSSCTAMALPTASGSFNKSTVASNGSATFSWSTSGATVSTNVDCWGTASGIYRGLKASGSITVTFTGAGEGYCNVSAINAAGESGGFDSISVTAAPTGCAWSYGYASVGTVANKCDIFGSGPNPYGEKYTCSTGYNWIMTTVGNSSILVHCE